MNLERIKLMSEDWKLETYTFIGSMFSRVNDFEKDMCRTVYDDKITFAIYERNLAIFD